MAIASLEQYLDNFLVYTVLEWLMHGLGVVLMEMELCSSGLLHDFSGDITWLLYHYYICLRLCQQPPKIIRDCWKMMQIYFSIF